MMQHPQFSVQIIRYNTTDAKRSQDLQATAIIEKVKESVAVDSTKRVFSELHRKAFKAWGGEKKKPSVFSVMTIP